VISVAQGHETDADQRVDANLRHAVRMLEGDPPIIARDGAEVSGLAPLVALSVERLAEWMASDLSKLDSNHPDRPSACLQRSGARSPLPLN